MLLLLAETSSHYTVQLTVCDDFIVKCIVICDSGDELLKGNFDYLTLLSLVILRHLRW
jgi:hypothetical protein